MINSIHSLTSSDSPYIYMYILDTLYTYTLETRVPSVRLFELIPNEKKERLFKLYSNVFVVCYE